MSNHPPQPATNPASNSPDRLDAIPLPIHRPRRLRRSAAIRGLARETRLHPDNLVLPLFIVEKDDARKAVGSMPGVFQTGVDEMKRDMEAAMKEGVRSFILFGVPGEKDAAGSQAWAENGVAQRALRAARKAFGGDAVLFADTCFCEYTAHGHCGCLSPNHYGQTLVDNDSTLAALAETAVSQARAGADVIAPSGMIDGMVAAIRDALDDAGHSDALICSYAVKYATALYGPFREAAESAPGQGDRRGMQMDPANADEAEREAALDEAEGADMLMVKPAVACLDVIRRVRVQTTLPVAAYMVSGEYAMVKAAGERGWIDADAVMWEHHLAIRRAGANVILTYAARDIARQCAKKN